MKITHKGLGIDYELPEVTQGDMEDIEAELTVPTEEEGRIKISTFNGQLVRMGCKLGWLNGLKEDEIRGMKPAAIDYIAEHIALHINEARQIPLE